MSDVGADTAKNKARKKVRGSRGLYVAVAVVAGLFAGVISLFFLAESLSALGIPDPGRITTFGLPFLRGIAWICMALSVGSFMASAFFISPAVPQRNNARLRLAPLTVDGHLAARTGAWSALVVALIALIEVPMVMSDVSGTPFVQTLNPSMLGVALGQIATAQVWLVTAVLAALVGVVGLVFQTWATQPALFLGAVMLVVPLGMEGHSAAGGNHDYGTNSLLFHLVFMTLWVGGLLGLIAHGRRLGPDMETAVRRYSALALIAVAVMAVSGVINAMIRMQLSDWLTTRYGLIVTTKLVLTIVLALFGLAHRQLTIPQLNKKPGAFMRLATVEVFVMAATVGIAITMGRTPPPPPRDPNLTSMEIQVGYELLKAPTFFNVWGMFRYDLLFGTIGLALAAGYLLALRRLRARGLSWSPVRTTWWMLGSLGLTLVMSNGIGMYIPATYSMHMLGHMILSMVIPLFLVLGAPLTLLLESTAPGPPGKPGVHDWVEALTQSRLLRFITHPAVNLGQFLFFFYAIYMSFDLYEFAISEHAGHLIMNMVFLVSGYIYFWEVIGPDPLPHRRPTPIRLAVLFASMPVHLFMGVYLMQLNEVMGEAFYRSLELPWNPDLVQNQKEGGGIAWGFGQFPLVIVFARLFIDWLRDDRSDARRHDAKADIDGDADLEEYNAMLAALRDDGDTRHYRQQ